MKVFVFGASSPTGKFLIPELLEKGYLVTALVRNPDSLTGNNHANLSIIKGDAFNPETYSGKLKGIDCVVSILGAGKSTKPTQIYSKAGFLIIQEMKKNGVKKLVTVSSGGVQKDDPTIQKNFIYKTLGLWWLRHIYTDMKKWEQILSENIDIDWVCVRPTYLQNSPLTKTYRINETYSPVGGWKISRADLAHFISLQVESKKYIHKKPVIAQ